MNKENFVQNVKRYCELAGVKPTVACRESGVGSSFINNIESRNQTPSVAKVQMLARYLGVTTSELLGEEIPNLAELQAIFKKYYRVDGELPPDAPPEAREAFRRLQAMEDLPGLVDEINPEDQWKFLRLGKQALDAKARREAAEEKPTPADGDGLTEEQRELLNCYDAAPPALRAAALAVLRSGEDRGKAPDDASTGR